jgi:glycosyltransferase involved in cell wall biosynthesis
MRILLLHQYFLEKDDSGGSRFNELTKHWADKGHQITVIAGMVHYATGKKRAKHKGKFIVKEKYGHNIEVIRCHVSEAYNVNFLGRLWAYFSFVFSSVIAGIFYARGKFNVVLVTSPPLFIGITGYIVSRIKRNPLVFEVRDLWPESAIDTGVLKSTILIKFAFWFEKFIYNKSERINTLTPSFYTKLNDEKHIPENKLWMIPNASDFTLSNKLLKSFDSESFRSKQNWKSKVVFTYIGAHGIANHLIQVIDAAEKLQETNAHFVLIGDGMNKPELIKQVKLRNLKNVQFIEPVSKADVFKYILASDVGMSILKKADTFKTIYSNKTFDYMACKKPVLMVIDGVSRELIEVAKAGLYVEPENVEEFKSQVKIYLYDKNLILEQGENGYNYARANFDRITLANKYIEKISELVE